MLRWFYCKEEDYVGVKCTDPHSSKHQLNVSPNTNFNKEDIGEQPADIRYLLIKTNNIPSVQDIKKQILSLQEEYDNSSEVNSFYLNGNRVWLDKATRVGLVNSLTMQKNNGLIDTTLWLDKTNITINIDKALVLLNAVEMYAMECYNNTHKHYAEIVAITNIDELVAFDITANYPKQLEIEIE